MNTLYCPAHISFLLHCHTTPEPWPNLDAPVYIDIIPVMIADGVIEPDDERPNMYRTTPPCTQTPAKESPDVGSPFRQRRTHARTGARSLPPFLASEYNPVACD